MEARCPNCKLVLRFSRAPTANQPMACSCGSCGQVFQLSASQMSPDARSTPSSSQNSSGSSNTASPIVESAPHVLAFIVLIIAALGMLRRVMMILTCCILIAAYLTNPIQDSVQMAECWRLLRERRASLLAQRDKKDIQDWKVFKVLRNTVKDAVQGWAGQRVAVNFVFCTLAYVDSQTEVDQDLCCIGALGTWKVLEVAALRRFAANSLPPLHLGEQQQ